MKYNIGDLLVKRRGKQRILVITDIQLEFEELTTGKKHYTLQLFDMRDNNYGNYHSEHVDTWLHSMYKHFPVKK